MSKVRVCSTYSFRGRVSPNAPAQKPQVLKSGPRRRARFGTAARGKHEVGSAYFLHAPDLLNATMMNAEANAFYSARTAQPSFARPLSPSAAKTVTGARTVTKLVTIGMLSIKWLFLSY
jgi:hypothetical protein